MSFEKAVRSIPPAAQKSKSTAKQGLSALKGDVAILVYPLFAFIVVLASLAIVNDLLSSLMGAITGETLEAEELKLLRQILNTISFILLYMYLAVMTGVFTSVVAASVIAELDGHRAPLLKGIKVTLLKLPRVASFSVLSLFFIPLGFLAQRHKWHTRPHDVIGSSFSLNIAQLTPAILSQNKGIFDTIRSSIDVLGTAWKENVMIKGVMYAAVILLGAFSFLPAYLENNWFDESSADEVSWLVGAFIFLSFLVMTRVLAAVFTATLYWRIINSKH